jgi:O-antigen/teichoic acid export membrane protein
MLHRLKELLFQNRSTRQTITKNVFWLSVSQVGSRLIRAVIIIYAARILGAAEYGVFSYALGLAGFFTIFADIGISQILTREIVQKPEEKKSYFSTAFWIKIFLLAITALIVIGVAPYFSKIEAAKILMPFIAIIVIFDGLREFSLALFRAREKMELEALVNIVTNIAITFFGFVVLQMAAGSKSLTLSYAFSVAMGFTVALVIARKQFANIFTHFQKSLIKPILNSAYPIALLGFLGVFMLNTDIIMLGWWRSAEEIGYYSAGQKIIQLLYTLPAILATSTFPVLSRFVSNKENDKIKALMEKAMSVAFFIAVPVFVGGVVLAKPLIGFVYGQEYLPATSAFQILLFTPFFIFPQIFLGNFILAHNEQRRLKLPVALGSVGNIAFNALMIPAYGIVGSAIATNIAQFLNVGLTWRVAKKINYFSTLRYLKKIIASAIIMGIFSLILNKIGANVIINMVLSAGIYFGALYLLREKILEEIIVLLKGIKK